MRGLIAIGGGGHCRACIDVLEAQKTFSLVGIVLQRDDLRREVLGFPVLGSDEDLPELLGETADVLIAIGQIGSAAARIGLYKKLQGLNARFPVIKSDFAYCSSRADIGDGSILMHGSIVNSGAQVGRNCIVNSQALIEHDVNICDHCHISTGSKINGGASIGEGVFIGSGCVIREGVSIGAGTVIGAGQVVMRDISDNSVIRGEHG
jgi:sugar O-acyltransferase (sialic acid O-acetyltransferase NeuD family)